MRAEGNEIKRGIFRDFPLRFRDASGRNREVDFDVLSVTRDGQPESWFTKKPNTGVVRIYAGKEDVFVSRGDHTYVLRYKTGRQIRWIDGKPELNWNVTGNVWTFPILAASYRLTLPGNVRPVRWTAYTGTARRAGHGLARHDRRQRRAVGQHDEAAGAACGPDRRGGNSRRRGRSAQRELLLVQGQPALDHRRHRLCRGGHLLPDGVERGRPRSQTRHHHPAVSSAQGRVAGACQLRPQLGLRPRQVARFHRGGDFARDARPGPVRRQGRGAAAQGDRQRARRGIAARRSCDLRLGEDVARRRGGKSPRPTAPRSQKSATISPKASSRKTRASSSSAISAGCWSASS